MKKGSVTAIEGNTQLLDGGAMFGNAPKEMWKKWLEPDAQNRIPLACRSFLIRYEGKCVLLETGIGAFFEPKLRERFGVQEKDHQLLTNLQGHGVSEDDIDYVILSHLHFDHAGGLLPAFDSGRTDLHFPNAKYVSSRIAFERSLKPHFRDRASYIPGLADKLKESGRLVLVDSETHGDVLPELLHFSFTDGHTPGQMHTMFELGTKLYFFAGDLIPGTSWIHLPLTMGYDRYAEKVIDEKQSLYEEMDLSKLVLLFTHDPVHVASSVLKNEKGRYEPVSPLKNLD